MPNSIPYRMPVWFPCFLSTLVAFAVSIKPAMSLPTLPAEVALAGVPPWFAMLVVTALGFVFGLVVSWALAKSAVATATDR